MKISELARVSSTGRSSIHFYRNLGLLPPPTRHGTRLHLYGDAHVTRLREIAHLRGGGIPLDEIRRRFAKRDARTQARKEASTPTEAKEPRVRSNDDAARDAIAVVAARAFVERGYDAVHVEDIAREAGIGKAKFYRLFPSKADLFVDCLQRLRLAVFSREERADMTHELSYRDEGRVRASAVIHRIEPYRMMTNLLTQVAYGTDADLARRARAALHDMITGAEPMFARAVKSGESRPMNTELVAYMTWGALMALGDRLAYDDRFSAREALEAYLDVVLHGTTPDAR
ncbi:Transcriptional regulator, MerR family / Transcriptional regulator, TetR family [Labilithrix luteola]|uniref:Transcriptional regulator, MerR family / Transcriptional regulator, TetR family n=1 Tax=Labilithrix luteola TaxID=1391654 RepID=A0A0K1QFK2_9BACT|nr:TetR family transcriptional regulator [Labilithrix luteola]AKV04503.1 Transcriptional regulator, MerR family / Transcriptional regulator, TetR family [Labilithrix luteola]